MSEHVTEEKTLVRRLAEIHKRLQHPPNAVKDEGIDLKRKPTAHVKIVEVSRETPPEPKPAMPPRKLPRRPHPKMDEVAHLVSRYFNIPVDDLRGTPREKKVVFARHIAMYLARTECVKSTTEIGRYFYRDHTSVMYALEKVRARLGTMAVMPILTDLRTALSRSTCPTPYQPTASGVQTGDGSTEVPFIPLG